MGAKRLLLATRRQQVGLSQEALAEHLSVERSTVQRWEAGRSTPQPWHRPRLAEALGVSMEQLAELLELGLEPRTPAAVELNSHRADTQTASPLLRLRQVVVGGFASEQPSVGNVESAVNHAHALYQKADYDAAAAFLPTLIAQLDQEPTSGRHGLWRASAYIAAAKLATKLGHGPLAWITADRAYQAARSIDHPTLIGLTRYQVACALMRNQHIKEARAVAAEAADNLAAVPAPGCPAALSARGALLLLVSVLAARDGEAALARQTLHQAWTVAESLGRDGNWFWTGFGPTNVAIHEVSVAVSLGDAERAYRHGVTIDTDGLPAGLVGRRSQVHLDLGRAAKDRRDDALAVLHLLEAERVAKQSVSRTASARRMISELLARERRNTTPGLRALASRAGVLDA